MACLAVVFLLTAHTSVRAAEPIARPLEEETMTAILDRDGSDGYTGDFVLIYNPLLENGASVRTGNLTGLVETADSAPVREDIYFETREGLYSAPDPYVTDELRQADGYAFDGDDPWQVGFRRVFSVSPYGELAFEVSAVSERCRVWSPVNPNYGPIEDFDPAYPEILAQEMDRVIPILEDVFGAAPDPRGDGKMNIFCFDFNAPRTLGFVNTGDVYNEVQLSQGIVFQGNNPPMVHINSAVVWQEGDLGLLYLSTAHEIQHSIGIARSGSADFTLWSGKVKTLTEFLSVAAEEVVYPGAGTFHDLAYWYSEATLWEDLAEDDARMYLRSNSKRQSGESLFDWSRDESENYAAMLLLVNFTENRGGTEAFKHILDRWVELTETSVVMADRMHPAQLVWEELGYEDYASFVEDFLLSVLLHEDEGPYRLHPFAGYDAAEFDGVENPFSVMVPIITDKNVTIRLGGYAVIKPVDGVYYPPATASKDACYVGITLKQAG